MPFEKRKGYNVNINVVQARVHDIVRNGHCHHAVIDQEAGSGIDVVPEAEIALEIDITRNIVEVVAMREIDQIDVVEIDLEIDVVEIEEVLTETVREAVTVTVMKLGNGDAVEIGEAEIEAMID